MGKITNIRQIGLVYFFSCVLIGTIILLPTIFAFVSVPEKEGFSELWILGPNRKAEDYPFSVEPNSLNRIFLGVGNHMGGMESYLVYVKLKEKTVVSENNTGLPSPIPSVFEYRFFLEDGNSWEKEVSFSFENVALEGNVVRVLGFNIDGMYVPVDVAAVLDETGNGSFYQLFFELWRYDSATSNFKFDNRSVGLQLNLTNSV